MKWLAKQAARFGREPVAIGGAVLLTVDAQWPNLSVGWKAAITAWVVVVQRAYSSPKAAVDEAKQAGRNEMAADIASLAPAA